MPTRARNSLNADLHYVPTIHIDEVAGAAVKAYVTSAGASATATIGAVSSAPSPAPKMAAFSSRGPLLAGSGDQLKPDVSAPGVDVLAAVSPDSGRSFDLLSGTSMSSPHVAGLGALLTQAHRGWSPAAMRSALMTTGYDTLDGDVFAHGAGHVKPNAANDPGLVYDAGWNQYLGYLCQGAPCVFANPAATCAALAGAGVPTKVTDFNQASIAIGKLAGVQTTSRTVTNVGSTAATYTAAVTGLSGVDVVVTPSSLALAPGASATFTVKFTTNSSATFDKYTSGHLTWSDGVHSVRSPLVVKPVALAAPGEVSGDGTAQSYGITFGYSGPFSMSTRGLLAATQNPGTVSDDPTNTFVVGGPGQTVHTITIPAGTTYARFALYDDNIPAGNDIDMYVYNAAGEQVGLSGSGTSQEIVNLVSPPAGDVQGVRPRLADAGWRHDELHPLHVGSGLGVRGQHDRNRSGCGRHRRQRHRQPGVHRPRGRDPLLGAVDYKNGANTVGSTIVYQKTP